MSKPMAVDGSRKAQRLPRASKLVVVVAKAMNAWKDFVADLMKIESLRLARDEAVEDWGEDIPTTLLFGNLGKSVAERFDEYSPEDRAYIFDTIERGMRAENVDLKTFVATGLLESLYAQAHRDGALLTRMEMQLGDVSRAY
ncbi:hypothetical protein [Burkholderia diffusa]|uniref:hypothetical protein n=1 Tax=Burkholderia diffusa TaxID=488732 RepID=UPI00158C5EBD|nr:hypothetical protein [Burkholderia diffusa]